MNRRVTTVVVGALASALTAVGFTYASAAPKPAQENPVAVQSAASARAAVRSGDDDRAVELVMEKMGHAAPAAVMIEALVSDDVMEQTFADTPHGTGPDVLISGQDGTVRIPREAGGASFGMGLKDASKATLDRGAADISSRVPGQSAVSHGTLLGGQIVAVLSEGSAPYVDFSVEVPAGHRLVATGEEIQLVDTSTGEPVGAVSTPWAVDASGAERATRYELLPGGVIRQHVELAGAQFPVSVDPSWWWWVKTATSCAGALAPIVALGAGALASKLPKLVSALSKLQKVKKIADAVREAGGLKEAAVLALKTAVNVLRSKLPGAAQKLIPAFELGAKRGAGLVIWEFIWQQFWDFLGIGSCGALAHEVIH